MPCFGNGKVYEMVVRPAFDDDRAEAVNSDVHRCSEGGHVKGWYIRGGC